MRENTLYPIVASLFEKFNIDKTLVEILYDSAKEKLGLNEEKVLLTKKISDMKEKHAIEISTLKPTKNVFLRASRNSKQFLLADDTEKREIIENIVWNLSFKNQTMQKYQFKSPYSALANVPKNADISARRSRRDSNSRGGLNPLPL